MKQTKKTAGRDIYQAEKLARKPKLKLVSKSVNKDVNSVNIRKICEKSTTMYPQGRTGTEAGYSAHRAHKEQPCKACSQAHAVRVTKETRVKRVRAKLAAPQCQPHTLLKWCDERTNQFPLGKTGTSAGYLAHKSHDEEPCAECSHAHLAKRRAQSRARYDKDKVKQMARNRRRRARKRNLAAEVFSVADIVSAYGTTCYLCGAEVDITITNRDDPAYPNVDHVVPLCEDDSPGDILDNVRLVHGLCNRRKSRYRVEDLNLPFSPPNTVNTTTITTQLITTNS